MFRVEGVGVRAYGSGRGALDLELMWCLAIEASRGPGFIEGRRQQPCKDYSDLEHSV